MPADLFQKDEFGGEYNANSIDNPQQMVQGAQFGGARPEEIARRQAGYDADIEQYAREESARQGQPDLLQTPLEDLQNRTEAGGTGMRDTVPGPDLEARGVRNGSFILS
jgi:hypothetical protein